MEAIKRWLGRQLSNPQVALLGVLLLIIIAVIFLFGDMLTPFFAALVIAYLLDGIVLKMQQLHIPRLIALTIVFIGFVAGIVLISFVLVPKVVNQLQNLAHEDLIQIVRATSKGVEAMQVEYDKFREMIFSDLFSQSDQNGTSSTNSVSTNIVQKLDQVHNKDSTISNSTNSSISDSNSDLPDSSNSNSSDSNLSDSSNSSLRNQEGESGFLKSPRLPDDLEKQITNLGTKLVTTLINSLKNLVVWIIYLILVPVLVFFLLKDKERILNWLIQFFPKDRSLASQIWHDVNIQTSNYIRGKFWEIIVVWLVTHLAFSRFGLNFALLLSLFVGLTVMVPYLGSAIMYIPITLVASYQFGWGSTLLWILVVYTIIQILDGNVLAPILLSEVTSLHPVAVIVAILIFGGLWGFWGVFFAIPLATLVNAIIKAWPKEFPHPPYRPE